MTPDQMRRALELTSAATTARNQLRDFVLLKQEGGEKILLGDPVMFRKGEYHRTEMQIPEDARRLVFRLWRKDRARRFNEIVRELNQLGASHAFRLIEFSAITGEPKI